MRRKGESRWYEVRRPDEIRPVVILTGDSIQEYLGEVTIAPITSATRDIPSEVLLTREDGMQNDCAINCDHIQTVSKGKIGSSITTLTQEKLKRLSKSIWFALNL